MNKSTKTILAMGLFLIGPIRLSAREGTIPRFPLEPNELALNRIARPGAPFDRCGRRFAVLGEEGGSFEAWAWPLKLVRDFRFSFFTEDSTRPVPAAEIVRNIEVTPEAAVLTFVFQSFTVRAVYMAALDRPGALILLDVDSTGPLSIVCGFLPVLQPMWPAGIGGQYAGWDKDLKAYVISEPTRKNHALVGSPAGAGMSSTPAHMLSDTPSEFRIEISDPNAVRGRYIPICLAGGQGDREDVAAVFRDLLSDPESVYRENYEHYQKLRERTLRIETPNPRLDLAFEWAKVAFDNLIVDHPALGRGMVAGLGASGTSGRPGFGWFFSGDAYINCLSLLRYGAFDDARGILDFTQKWQRKDGKMAHELSQAEGYVDWWKDYPYGYIHGDTTPYFICAMDDYVRLTGDLEFLMRSWPSLKKAYAWCLSTDENGDGLMDNRKAGLGALEYGALTGIESDIYMSAIWVQAAGAMERLANAAGDLDLAAEAGEQSMASRKAFEKSFWDPELGIYAYAFDRNGRRVREISPWGALGLMWELGNPEHGRQSLRRMCSAELVTDWGVRSLSDRSGYYQPLNYNYGAVWPFLTSWVTSALYAHHMPLQAFQLLKSTAELTFAHGLGAVTEVFSGDRYAWPQEAVFHQGFSTAGVTLPTVRGLLGLDGNTAAKTVTFAPKPPGDWERLKAANFRVGIAAFFFDWRRAENRIEISASSSQADGFQVRINPLLASGTRVTGVTLDGRPAGFESRESNQGLSIAVDFPAQAPPRKMVVTYRPTVEVLPVLPCPRVGGRSQALKITSVERTASRLEIQMEGIAGKTYSLRVLHPELIVRALGGDVRGDRIHVRIPDGPPGDFVKHGVEIQIRD